METSVYKPLHTSTMAEQQQPMLNTVLNQTTQTQHLLLLQILHLVRESQRTATQDNEALNKEKMQIEVERHRYDDLQFVCNTTSSDILLELGNRTRQKSELMSRLYEKESEFNQMEQELADNKRQYQDQKEKLEFEKSTRQMHLQRFLKQLRNISNINPVTIAVQKNDLGVVEMLLDAGEDVEAEDGDRQRPMYYASWNGNLELVKLLARYGAKLNVQNGDDIGSTPTGVAIFNGHKDIVVWLLDNGVSVNSRDKYGYSLLHDAAFYEELDIAKILLDRGADVHAQHTVHFDYDPLHTAASKGNAEMVRLLVEKGADIEARTNRGYTPLILAVIHGDLKTTKLLTEFGADTSAKDDFGFNATRAASYFNNTQLVDFLTSVL